MNVLKALRHWRWFVFPVVILGALVLFGTWFFVHGQMVMRDQLKGSLRTAAAIASLQFDPADIAALAESEDPEDPAFDRVVRKLWFIRESVPAARFAYIMRRTDDAMTLAFVADADALSNPAELDWNRNGTVDEDEEPGMPGDEYDISEVPALQSDAFENAATDEDFTIDQWGTLMSGYAPIRDENGDAIAIIGIDMVADDFIALSQRIFSPVAFVLFLLGCAGVSGYGLSLARKHRIESLKRLDTERSGVLKLAFHQLGAPLSILKWSLDLLEDEEKTPSEAVKEHKERVHEATDRIDAILEELKEADRVHERVLAYDPRLVTMTDVIDDVVKASEKDLKHRKQHVQIACPMGMKLHIDPKLIGGVIRELLDNAMIFSHEGAEIGITAEKRKNKLQVTVTDTGVGIPAEDMPRIFEEFTRGSNASRMSTQGNGLGLYISRGVIERAGGEIWIKSVEGKGTTATFTVPVEE